MTSAPLFPDRLDFQLPDFTRLSWIGNDARELWGPRMNRVTQAWLQMEWMSVVDGVRPCGLTVVGPEDLIPRSAEWAEHGLTGLPVDLEAAATGSYRNGGSALLPGDPFAYRVVIGTPENVKGFKTVWEAHDNGGIGRYLGFPQCCLDFFQRYWIDEDMVDTTWAMAVGTESAKNENQAIEVSGPVEANILWRWMGIRAVPSLPCSFECEATVKLGKEMIDVGRKWGFDEEMDWLLEILAWPVEWTALHGIAEIKTPILKVSTLTDATASKYAVRRPGVAYPKAGAMGLKFPFRLPRKTATESGKYQRGIDNPIPPTSALPAWYASDNGFNSIAAMEQAHRPIIEIAKAALGNQPAAVVDLGCGNGALLKELQKAHPSVVPYGVELEADRVAHARDLHPDAANNFVVGDIFGDHTLWSPEYRYKLAIMMPGRLLEAGPERAAQLRRLLGEHCDQILLYAYGDWLSKYRDLRGLAMKAGFSLLSYGSDARASLATVSRPETVSAGSGPIPYLPTGEESQ